MDRDKEEAEFPILDKSLPAHWREGTVGQPADGVVFHSTITLRRQVALQIRKPPKVITGGCN